MPDKTNRPSAHLRKALARRRARANALATASPRHAHTASGREILGYWGWFERVVLFVTFASIFLGVVAFMIDFEDRKQARADRQNDAITRAWTLITTPAVGNSGKGPALEYLNGLGIPLTGIDLSCATMGGEDNWDAEKKTCEARTNLIGVNLEGANLRGAQLEGADLRFAQLQGADLWRAQLSEANFTGATGLKTASFSNPETSASAWAWADQPPVGLGDIPIRFCLFDAALHDRGEPPETCTPP